MQTSMSTNENKEMAALRHQIRELTEQKRTGGMEARMGDSWRSSGRWTTSSGRSIGWLLMRLEIEKLARTIQLKELETNMELEKAKAKADKKELQAKAEADKRELRLRAEADNKELQAKAEADKKEMRAEAAGRQERIQSRGRQERIQSQCEGRQERIESRGR
jgi:hypothetical protein